MKRLLKYHVVIRYGLQYQVLFPYEEGHLSIGLDLNAEVVEVAQNATKYLSLPI